MSNPNASQIAGHKRFSLAHCQEAMSRHFPYCPPGHRAAIIERLAGREWTKRTKMAQAVSIVVHTYIRHNLTEYDDIINKDGLTRDEARLIVRPELDEWYAYWHNGIDPLKPESAASDAKTARGADQ